MTHNLTQRYGAGALFAAILSFSDPASAQVVVNGSFEQGMDPGDSVLINAGDSTSINGWACTGGTVDYIGTHWVAAAGSRSIDLSGHSAGTLSQIISGFQLGATYRLSFDLAGNPEGPPAIKNMQINIGSASHNFSFDTTGHSDANMGWTLATMDFLATAPTLTLSFTSLDNTVYGPAIDAVSLAFIVPEPASLSLLALGAAGWAARKVIRKGRGDSLKR